MAYASSKKSNKKSQYEELERLEKKLEKDLRMTQKALFNGDYDSSKELDELEKEEKQLWKKLSEIDYKLYKLGRKDK